MRLAGGHRSCHHDLFAEHMVVPLIPFSPLKQQAAGEPMAGTFPCLHGSVAPSIMTVPNMDSSIQSPFSGSPAKKVVFQSPGLQTGALSFLKA